MRRREMMASLGGAAMAAPLIVRAQERVRLRTVGVILVYSQSDPAGQARLSAFRERLRNLGWTEGSNVRIDVRWTDGRLDRMRADASELVNMPADVIVASSTPLLGVLQSLTRSIPIVFTQVADPLGSGFVASYARPGANITGFADFDPSIAGKWIELLKEAVPTIGGVTVLSDPAQSNHQAFLDTIKSSAVVLKVHLTTAGVRDRVQIEQAIAAVAGQSDRGLAVLPGPTNNTLRDTIVRLAAQHRLPAIYPHKYFASDGGLMSYGVDQVNEWPNAAAYTDRILRGEKPDGLPVQAPTKYELTINLKTAEAMGLAIPSSLLARADEMIE
jgi:ABC-type uncharacterized transport system substrate-binding protein